MHLEKPESDSPFAAENVSRVEVTYNSADVPTGSEPNRPVLSYYKLDEPLVWMQFARFAATWNAHYGFDDKLKLSLTEEIRDWHHREAQAR